MHGFPVLPWNNIVEVSSAGVDLLVLLYGVINVQKVEGCTTAYTG